MAEILEPKHIIVDAHHHLRDRDGETYLAPDYLADVCSGHKIVASVAVETGVRYRPGVPAALQPVGETAFLADIAQATAADPTHVAAAIVGYADLALGDAVAATLDAHIQAGCGYFRGVRMAAPWHSDARLQYARRAVRPHELGDPTVRAGFAALAARELTFDAWVYHTQLGDVEALARAFPAATIVIDHLGGPLGAGPYANARTEVFHMWRTSLESLAPLPNVVLKIGGFGMPVMGFGFDRDPVKPSAATLVEAWRPYIDTAISCFGAARCMFESNFPPDRVSTDFATLWNAFKLATTGISGTERHALFAGTASRVYRIPLA
jgi:L-fuconolactonase